MRAGKGNRASESPESPYAEDVDRLANSRGSSSIEDCSAAEGRVTSLAAQGGLSPALTEIRLRSDEISCSNEAADEELAVVDALMLLANTDHRSSLTGSGGHDTGRSSERDVDGGRLIATINSVTAKQSSKKEQDLELCNASRPESSSPAPKTPQQNEKKQRKYANKYKVQFDRWLQKVTEVDKDALNCLEDCLQIIRNMPRGHNLRWASLVTSEDLGYRKLRDAFGAALEQIILFHRQVCAVLFRLQQLYPRYSWDEWGSQLESMSEERPNLTKDIMASGFFYKLPEEVQPILKTWPALAHVTSAIGRLVEVLRKRTGVFFEFAAFCDRKKGLASPQASLKQNIVEEYFQYTIDSDALVAKIKEVYEFLLHFEAWDRLQEFHLAWNAFFKWFQEKADCGLEELGLEKLTRGPFEWKMIEVASSQKEAMERSSREKKATEKSSIEKGEGEQSLAEAQAAGTSSKEKEAINNSSDKGDGK